MKWIYLVVGLMVFAHAPAQVYRVKGGIIFVPANPGFTIGELGIERTDQNPRNSWQARITISGGALGVDASTTHRNFVTIERTHYFREFEVRSNFFYSAFIETGRRKIFPGFVHDPPDAILNYQKAFEINPGIGVGAVYHIRKWGFEIVGGPKLIFADYKDKYYNANNTQYYFIDHNDVTLGWRAMATLSFQF